MGGAGSGDCTVGRAGVLTLKIQSGLYKNKKGLRVGNDVNISIKFYFHGKKQSPSFTLSDS